MIATGAPDDAQSREPEAAEKAAYAVAAMTAWSVSAAVR